VPWSIILTVSVVLVTDVCCLEQESMTNNFVSTTESNACA